VLIQYEVAFGQKVNFAKTDAVFNKGVNPEWWNAITLCLDIREVLSYDKYLGLPTMIGRSGKKPFLFVIDRIKKRVAGWMGKLMSWARMEVLIKAVAQAIPTNDMSIFKFPADLCHSI